MTGLKFRSYVIAIVFIAIISFPIVNKQLKIVPDIASSENRQMSVEPIFDLKLLDPFPNKYEKFYTDNFTIRSIMIKYYNLLNLEFFKKSPIPEQVLIGKDGWLFMVGNELESYRGKNRLSNFELESFRLELEFRKKFLEKRGCKFYLIIAPAKANIYPEKIPENIYRVNSQPWGEQLYEYLKKSSSINLINANDILLKAKKTNLVYYKLDNHWNKIGAYSVANESLKLMQKDFPEIKTTLLNDYNLSETEVNGGNIVSMLANTSSFKDVVYQLTPPNGYLARDVAPFGYTPPEGFPYPKDFENEREIKNSKKPKLLIISDSFGENVFPFFAENFSRSIRIFDGWQYKLNEDIVIAEKPDVVVLIALESNIRSMLNFQSRLKLDTTNLPNNNMINN